MNRSDWIVEVSAGGASGRLAHVSEPWFVCSFAANAGLAGEFHGLTVEAEGGFFCNFTWRDGLPDEKAIRRLCAEALELLAVLQGQRDIFAPDISPGKL
jgi:hypothetical protein